MRTRRFLLALLVLASAYGCTETPVQANADGARATLDGSVDSDTTGRGGNIMGSGH